jgi:hypothetical protein
MGRNKLKCEMQDVISISSTLLCELPGWCFETLTYDVSSEYVRCGTYKDVRMGYTLWGKGY